MSWSEFGPPALLRQATDFHQYAYGVLGAVKLAAALGLPDVSLLELGVAGGNGLLELERLATEVECEHSVSLALSWASISGTGMPPPLDHRDVPYAWREGFFRMDGALLVPV